jgi:hypothetical protein
MSWVVTSIEQAEDSRELRKLGSPTKLSSTNRFDESRAIHVLYSTRLPTRENRAGQRLRLVQ